MIECVHVCVTISGGRVHVGVLVLMCMCLCVCLCVYLYVCVCLRVSLYVCVHALYVCVCLCVFMYVCVCANVQGEGPIFTDINSPFQNQYSKNFKLSPSLGLLSTLTLNVSIIKMWNQTTYHKYLIIKHTLHMVCISIW